MALIFLVFALVSSFPWLVFARSLQGVASASIAVAGMGSVTRVSTIV